jgi:hypothetical protein
MILLKVPMLPAEEMPPMQNSAGKSEAGHGGELPYEYGDDD